jgi:hypothetical protein
MNVEPMAAGQITGEISAANVGATIMAAQIAGPPILAAAFADAAMRAVVKALSPHTC